MFRGLYTTGSALVSNTRKLDVIGNNIANVNTTGFKRDLVLYESFEDVLISKVNGTFPYDGFDPFIKAEVEEKDGTYTVRANGGYFRVNTGAGTSYSKEIRFAKGEDGELRTFHMDQDGKVDTSYGYQVIGLNGPIKVGDGELKVDEKGNVLEDGKVIDRLVFQAFPTTIGTMNGGLKTERIEIDFTQGNLEGTTNPMDFALRGKGYFTIETPDGIRYTRDGSFKLNAANELVTAEGYKVMGTEGPIVVDGVTVSANEMGEILVDGQLVNKFKITAFDNNRDLRKIGEGLYKPADGLEIEEIPFEGAVVQGYLERSNAEPIKEMVEMMTLFRGYESSQRLIRAYDDTIGRAVNDVGRL